MNTALLDKFKTDASLSDSIEESLTLLCSICAANSADRGFHDDELALSALTRGTPSHDWTTNAVLQAELARIASEVGEAIEACRKPKRDEHLESYSNFVVELADIIIRVCDLAGKRSLPLGPALIDKLLYNATRPYKHGKNS